MTNRMTAQGYTAWDNIFTGNRYNLRLWLAGFKAKLRDGLDAQIKAIMTKEGLSAASAIIGLAIVFGTMARGRKQQPGRFRSFDCAGRDALPRQIEMTNSMHQFTSGWNELLAVWTRLRGVSANLHLEADPQFDARIKPDMLILREREKSNTVVSVDEAIGLRFFESDWAYQRARRQRFGQVDS